MKWLSSLINAKARRAIGIVACCLAAVVAMMILLVLLAAFSMQAATADRILTVDSLPDGTADTYDCIIVLGAGLKDDGTPSHMLADRVIVAGRIYNAVGPLPIIMSGDHTGDYDEVTAMKQAAVALGVDSRDVFLDHQGYSTYESIYRAKEVFGARRILIVTQEYHLHRALFIARELGLEANGISADLRSYRMETGRHLREYLARYKDMFQTGRYAAPDTNGLTVDLSGNGDDT